ncbi:MAG TPA: dihydrolipoyl dehydrogenase, partial [Spirochaeta sp.]|nr:dihydrolipoyl dehydrogenase [Spirochaeta sp.]
YGIKTVLIEEKDFGGTCLNRGCVPTKAMLHSCEVLENAKTAGKFGIKTTAPEVDMPALYKYKDGVVRKLKSGVAGLLKSNGVENLSACASFAGGNELLCSIGDNASSITADNIILASGSAPAVPPIEGLSSFKYWTSDTLLEKNPELPGSITIIGGGVIGVECATILNDLGVKVIILEMQPQLLPNMDEDIAAELERHLDKAGIIVRSGVRVEKVSNNGKETEVTIITADGSEAVFSNELMVAVGRRSFVEGLNLEAAGIHHDRGIVSVNTNMQTNVPSIYAIGDVTGGLQLAHAASAQGLLAVDHIAGRGNYTNMNVMPSCVYTRPEISSVGLSEAGAKAAKFQIKCGTFSLAGNSKAMIDGENKGFVKIVSDEKTGAVLGGQMIGPRATELISEIALAISSELTIEELGGLIHAHPTVSEAILESVHDIDGMAVHKMPARK